MLEYFLKMTSKKRRRLNSLQTSQSEVMAEINITPLTDVLLVLVIIFLITAAASVFGFNFRLPEGTPKKFLPHEFKGVTTTIPVWSSEKQVIFVDSHLVNISALPSYLYQEHLKKQTSQIAMRIDNRVPYRIVIQVMDAAKAAGLNDITFIAPVAEEAK